MNPPARATTRYTLAAAALVVLPLLLAATSSAAPTTTRALAITTASANPKVAFGAFDGNPPKVFDINGDGILEIIAQNDNQWVYVFDSKTGRLLAQVKTNFPPGWGARSFNGPEVTILTEDGKVHLVLANSAAVLTSYRFDTTTSTKTKFSFVKEWDRRLSDCHSNPGMDSKPVLADLDQDGRFEILAATEEVGLFALRHDGRVFWKRCIGGGNAEPTVGDLNLDGFPDVVFGSDGGIVSALNGRTGATLWSYNVKANFNVASGSMPVGAAVGQLDGQAGPDVVVGVRDSHDATNWDNDHALLLALDSGGRLLWGRQDAEANPLTYTHPIIADAEPDGEPEVYWADWNTNGHKPPFDESLAWQVTGPGHFYRYDAAGTLVWRQTLDTWWSNKDLALADVDEDGVQEVFANGPSGGHDGIWYLDGRTGEKEAFVDVHPWKVQREPVVADLWNTGTMQWVVEAAANAASAGGPAILVYDTHARYNAVWPHLPYPTLGPANAPPTGTFNATFTVKSPSEWWQEVTVTPASPRTLVKVEVRLNGDFWRSMEKRKWGAWTSSYNTPAGTMVDFLATDSTGAVSQSAPFKWMDGTLTRGSVPPGDPTPAPFFPTFEVGPNVNEWWVEVTVRTSEPLSGVDVRVDGGAWTALSATEWGTWAQSMFVAAGSAVQFRATTTYGAEALSQTYTWLQGGDSFAATFEPRAQGNDWWVEVQVTSNSTLAGVEANVNGGAWTALGPTSWGTWAKGFFVADGSTVRFRATNSAGSTAESGPYPWT